MNEESSLYDKIGGKPAIEKLLHAFYDHVIQDPDLSPYFEGIELTKVLHMQTEFLGAALDGPVEYTGLELTRVHADKGITRSHFSKFVNLLFNTLQELKLDVSEKDITEIIDRINLYADSVVGRGGMDG